jgi:glycosyltransferase involved in cell wall biosynthesis
MRARLVDARDRKGLSQALAQVLTDEKMYQELRQRSQAAARDYFSWDAIASQFVTAMSTSRVTH